MVEQAPATCGYVKSISADENRYHDENTRMEDLVHPEDIEHFRKHDEMEDEAERIKELDKMPIVVQNIPRKFRVNA